MLYIYAGNGKGKTTAAFGLALRFAGSGQKALVIQFLKNSDSSEITAVREVGGIDIFNSETSHGFYHTLSDEKKALLATEIDIEVAAATKAAISGSHGLLVLDEAIDAINLGLIDEKRILELVMGTGIEIVLTGRNPSEALIGAADYYTEFICKKHPYEKGVLARLGIEF